MVKESSSFSANQSLYEQAVKKRVCSKCVDFGADGICHSHDPQGCAVMRNLEELVRIAESLHELKLDPYIQAVRQHLCEKCLNRHSDGTCDVRGALDCGLDRYLELVIEAIEEVDKILARKAKKRGNL